MAQWGDACCRLITEMHNRYAAKAKKEKDGKTKNEREEGKEETQRSVSTHTVTVICRNGEVCPSANVFLSNVRKLHSSSKGAGQCWGESQPVYIHTVVLGKKAADRKSVV